MRKCCGRMSWGKSGRNREKHQQEDRGGTHRMRLTPFSVLVGQEARHFHVKGRCGHFSGIHGQMGVPWPKMPAEGQGWAKMGVSCVLWSDEACRCGSQQLEAAVGTPWASVGGMGVAGRLMQPQGRENVGLACAGGR